MYIDKNLFLISTIINKINFFRISFIKYEKFFNFNGEKTNKYIKLNNTNLEILWKTYNDFKNFYFLYIDFLDNNENFENIILNIDKLNFEKNINIILEKLEEISNLLSLDLLEILNIFDMYIKMKQNLIGNI